MPDTIERTIYKLELDSSAYIAGVDSLSNSTKKLSDSQDKANLKLAELQKQHNAYKKNLAEITAVIKANEKETLDLSKQLNTLKDSEKGASAEAVRLKTALRDIAVNTREFKIEAGVLKDNITATTNQIRLQAKEVKAAESANGGFTKSLSGIYGGLSKVAQLIPGLGIGGLIAGLAAAITELATAETVFERNTKLLNEGMKAAATGISEATGEVDVMKLKFELARQGLLSKKDVLDEYNNTLGKTVGVTKDFNVAEQSLIDNAAAYIKIVGLKAQAQAIANLRIKESEKALTADLEDQRGFAAKAATFLFFNNQGDDQAYRNRVAEDKKRAATNIKNDANEKIKLLTKEEIRVQTELALATDEFKDKPKAFEKGVKKSNAEIVNIYAKELQKLKADIAKLDEKGFTTEATITKAIEEDFKKRSDVFADALKNKQLTADQFADLSTYLNNLQKLTLEQNLKTFREQKRAYLKSISDTLVAAEFEESSKRISLLQDSFERERQTIILESEKTVNAVISRREKEIAAIKKEAAKSGLTISDIAPQLVKIRTSYLDLLDSLDLIREQKLQKLSFDTFEKLSQDAKRLLDAGNLGISQGSLINIQAQTKLFQEGKISYEQYQKELTEIAKFEANERFRLEKLFLTQEIKLRQDKLANDKKLTTDQIVRLEDEIRRLQQQLANAEKGNIVAEGKGAKPEDDSRLDKIVKYTQALGGLISQVIGFWQAANAAESEALDRSIALQEKRVSAAQRIAERGNAQYLKAEEDRLTELNVKRENAARKQLGINAALQGSEILVALISGIAQGVKLGGPLGAIASLAAIVAAIAGAFAIAQSLKPPEPKLFKGTPHLERGGHPAGRDTIPAWLNEGEAVIPTEKNKKYKKSVEAIYHGKVPAEVLNEFVENYVRNRVEKTSKENVTKDRKIVEKSDITGTVHKVFSEVSDKKISTKELNSIINKKEDKQTAESLVVENIFNLINNRLNKTVNDLHDNKYSQVVDKVFSENKSLTENRNIVSLVHKALNETSEKDISIKQISSVIKNIEEKKASNVIQTIMKLVNEKVEKNSISLDLQKSLVNKNVTIEEVKKYSDIINRIEHENKIQDIVNKDYKVSKEVSEISNIIENKNTFINENISKYKNFVQNISKIPAKVLNNFIENHSSHNFTKNYEERRFFKGTTDLQGKPGIDKIPIWASQHEAIIPEYQKNLYEPVINAVFKGTVPAEHLNNFVNNYHSIKPVPLPDYSRIKEATEIHINSDGRMSVLLTENNKKLDEQNSLQRQTLRALKTIGVNVNMDKNGFAMSIMEVAEQIKINTRV